MWTTVVLSAVFLVTRASGQDGRCCAPGVCVEPPSTFKRVLPIAPRQQWNTAGGFCGSLSIQVMLLGHGAWVSQDLIRKANVGAPCFGHGDALLGCEVGPENYAQTATGLRLKHEVWDYTQAAPQATAFKAWIKAHLVQGHPVMWAPICKGDSHTPYGPASCPGGGHFDHHEPIIGIGSHHALSDPAVYEDDWVLHYSAQDLMPYYRELGSMEDDADMQGNCKNASAGFPDHEAYPCFYSQVTYGLATGGLDTAPTLPVHIDVDQPSEPNPRAGQPATLLHATVRVSGLSPGRPYLLYRYGGVKALPAPDGDVDLGYENRTAFNARADTWTYRDPHAFASDTATYYLAVPGALPATA